MAKDTYYFSHDYNIRSNKKIKRMIQKHGATGYGIYWALNEDLYNNKNSLPLDILSVIARELRVKIKKVEAILKDFELFENNGEVFWSEAVAERLNKRTEKSAKASVSANIRWGNDANALRPEIDRNAIKERKGDERKGDEINKAAASNFFRIRGQTVLGLLSEYFKKNNPGFFETWQMQNQGAKVDLIFTKMDTEYVGYDFNSENHIINTFKSIAEKLKKNDTHKNIGAPAGGYGSL